MTPAPGTWHHTGLADLYAPGADIVRLWEDGTVAALVWPDGSWSVWMPGVREALGEPAAAGVCSGLPHEVLAQANAALRSIVDQQQNTPKEALHERP